MNLKWTKGLSKQRAVEVKVDLLNAQPALKRLTLLLQTELESSLKEMASKESFHTPSWSHKQANYLGEQRALRDVINLISGDKNAKQEKD